MSRHDEITVAKLAWLAREHGVDTSGWERLAALNGAGGLDVQPDNDPGERLIASSGALDDLDAHRLSNNLDPDAYRRRPFAGGYCWPGEITLVAGAGGYGKTMWVLLLLLALASGKKLLNSHNSPKLIVAIVSLEEPRQEVLHKLRALVKHLGVHAQLLDDIIIYGSDDPAIQALAKTGARGQPIVDEAGLRSLREVIAKTGAQVVAVDCQSVLVPVGANDNGFVYDLTRRIKGVLQEYDCALVLIMHTRKGAKDDAGPEGVAGASAWVNGARLVVRIHMATPRECEAIGVPFGEDSSIRKVEIEKANFLPPGGRESFVQLVSVVMHPATADYPADSVGVLVPFQASPGARSWPPGMLREMVEVIAQGTPAGPYSSGLQSGRNGKPGRYPIPALSPVAARHVGLQADAAKRAAQAALGRLIESGWVVVNKVKKGGHDATTLTVDWGATPWAAEPAAPGAHVS